MQLMVYKAGRQTSRTMLGMVLGRVYLTERRHQGYFMLLKLTKLLGCTKLRIVWVIMCTGLC